MVKQSTTVTLTLVMGSWGLSVHVENVNSYSAIPRENNKLPIKIFLKKKENNKHRFPFSVQKKGQKKNPTNLQVFALSWQGGLRKI